MIDKLLNISLEEIKGGYLYNSEDKKYSCLICGKTFELGEVFSFDERFYEARRAVEFHVQREHGSMLDMLMSSDKKYTGLTENQKELFSMFYDGLSDSEIAKKMGVAQATIRHQRFVFREKAKQAKLYLAIYELITNSMSQKKEKNSTEDLIDVHNGAKMVDDRYFVTKAEEDKIMGSAFETLAPLKLISFSGKEKKKIVILRKIAEEFERGIRYREKEINEVLKAIYDDYATIRRYLIEYGFFERTIDCKEYWLK